ncbi:class I SAM-dependent methyltransferase [Aestuariibaculum sediminum]|uniref:Class I SAM-dependent methyltransferase n=1 Tax=Aestuariibaculum sediminum TaxID=2770637 RepID=A0A8J6UHM7_9FLAO|nr:class I SAM-dependent methyltransferase [Aestuariibaculum sediminum]MBD0833101.1 class I SAM-dependent methyltransferase [Aestuariibaculum sediminum]
MTSIDYSKLKARPELEDFSGKYENTGIVSRYLVKEYFKAVNRLVLKTTNISTAHEIGAGEGMSTKYLKQMVENLSASEYVNDLVEKAVMNNPDISIFQESVYELTKQNNSIDLVFLLEVLEHLDYPSLALNELSRVSKRYLVLGVPREPLWRFLNMCRFKYLKDFGNTPGHLNHWSKKQIINLIEEKFGKVIAVETPIPWTIILAEKRKPN